MATIHIQIEDRPGGYHFNVTVREGRSFSHHRVTLDRIDYERLAAGRATPEELVEESFRFLLEREPKESILGAFDLTIISRYFPSYEARIRERLQSKA